MACRRPDRSDAHLSPEEEARREAEAREYFDGVVPKRHTKPQRSDYSDTYADALAPADAAPIPELHRLQDLGSHPEKLVCRGSEAVEEYVETEYYKDLNCIDKQHHTTGTGFIKIERSNGRCLNLNQASSCGYHGPCRGNPATNEWFPSTDDVIPTSHKPNRSDI